MINFSGAPGEESLRDALFEAAPHGYLILDPGFMIIDVNQQYLNLTRTRREDLVGVPMFDAFPDNPDDPTADGVRNLRRSLQTARATGRPHAMAVQKYDIPLRRPGGGFEERYWKPLNTPVLRNGEVVALIHHVIDVTEETIFRRDQSIRLRSAQRLEDLAFWEYDPSTGTIYVSRAFSVMMGFPEREGTLSSKVCFARIHPDDRDAVCAVFEDVQDAPEHTTVAFTHRLLLPDGTQSWLSSQGELVRDHRDALPRFVLVSMDITESKRREEKLSVALADRDHLLAQKQALLAELNHRSKNVLSLVQAIAAQTHRTSPDGFMSRFSERLVAMSAAQDLLVGGNNWKTVDLGQLARSQLAHFKDLIGTRIRLGGPRLMVTAEAARDIGMAFHELATNAGKYGALSNADGEVHIAWDSELHDDGEPRLMISWTESGGPPVEEPAQKGFGSTVTTSMLSNALGGEVSVDYAPTGLRWRLTGA